MLAPRQQQGIDQPIPQNRRPLDPIELGIDEADIERRIVDHKWRVAYERQEILDLLCKQRLGRKEIRWIAHARRRLPPACPVRD